MAEVVYLNEDAIREVIRKFEQCEYAPAEFTHARHLTVGCWYLCTLPAAEALNRIARRERQALLLEGFLMQADMYVGRHHDVHQLWIRQFEIAHQLDIFVDRAHLQSRVAALLLADGGDGVAFVVVGGKHQRLLRQFQ